MVISSIDYIEMRWVCKLGRFVIWDVSTEGSFRTCCNSRLGRRILPEMGRTGYYSNQDSLWTKKSLTIQFAICLTVATPLYLNSVYAYLLCLSGCRSSVALTGFIARETYSFRSSFLLAGGGLPWIFPTCSSRLSLYHGNHNSNKKELAYFENYIGCVLLGHNVCRQ